MKKIIVAIDGYSSCGKSTMAKELARVVGYAYIDTGAMYRAVTLYAMRSGFFVNGELDEAALEKDINNIRISFIVNADTGCSETLLNGENVEKEIRRLEVSNRVSIVSALPFVRRSLVEKQHLMGEAKGIVMDGRDIGTVVFPDAELKIFVTASPEVRARRRFDEMVDKGENITFEEILENVKARDYQDSHRVVSPLRKADDAIELDNSDMTIDEQNAWMLEQFNRVVKS